MLVLGKRIVGILALATIKRHRGSLVAGLTLVISGMTASADTLEQRWHPVDEIASAAENYLKITAGLSDDRLIPTAGYLDPRLRLAYCGVALEPFLRPGVKISGRTIVGVRCTGAKPWKIYLPVHVAVMEKVLVSAEPMSRGHLIQAEDVEVATRDISAWVGGYYSRKIDISGLRVKRGIGKGVVLGPSLLQADAVIRKGQSVTLIVDANSLNISMTGRALTDGAINQRIRVENVESGRVVEGLVRSTEQVEVLVR